MTDYKDLKKEHLDSLIINDDKTSIVFRTKSGYLYFYQGNITSVSGMFLFDAKYGNEGGLPLKKLADPTGQCLQVSYNKDWLLIQHEGLTYQGKVLESVLLQANTYNQLTGDF